LGAVAVAEAAAKFPELFPRNRRNNRTKPLSVIFDIVIEPPD
jgi:hypothetical protein